ncbi:MAG: hypothetical protein DRI90_15925 [Deltaproteobacteria bacterium]|nr:MAG: hypothetical protein DRI90_15925 [Deltaproteobacteria bacterium]
MDLESVVLSAMRWSIIATIGVLCVACGSKTDDDHDTSSSSTIGGIGGMIGTGGSGGTTGTGGTAGGGAGIVVPPDATLPERLSVASITMTEGVKAGVSNWRIWGTSSLGVAPVFTAPLANCETLVGFTTGSGNGVTARVARLSVSDQLVESYDLGGYELRGLAAEPDGHFGALLWSDSTDKIYVGRYDLAGATSWPLEELTNSDNTPDDFGIGDSRLEYGAGKYGAYYHVHSTSGHEGDTMKWVDAATGGESTAWAWGCSHSMSNLLRFNPGDSTFMPACVTDCYPGTSGSFNTNSIGGLYINHSNGKIMDVDAGCNGSVAGELGGAALAPSGWLVAFNAHQNPATLGQASYEPSSMDQDIGIATVGSGYSPGSVVWLTTTPNVEEADSSIARWQPSGASDEQYIVGWAESGTTYKLARIDRNGAVLEAAVDVSATASWGHRDDPFRVHDQGDVVWAWFDAPGSTTLQVARIASGNSPSCASF